VNSASRRSFLEPASRFRTGFRVFGTGSPAQAPGAQARAPQSSPSLPMEPWGDGHQGHAPIFGCYTCSDQSVVERAATWASTTRYRPCLPGRQQRAHGGAALKKYRDKVYISSKTQGKAGSRPWRTWKPA